VWNSKGVIRLVQAALNRQDHVRILYDADRLQRPSLSWFDPEYWHYQGGATLLDSGRGASWMVSTAAGPAVLKHYLRGGQVARLTRDRYVFTGWERSRALREWRLLASMRAMHLPVPQPLASLCSKNGRTYTAALLSQCIERASPLHEALQDASPAQAKSMLASTLQAIVDLHRAAVYHPDMNFSNVLVDDSGKVWLIDFDRARLLKDGAWRQRQALPRMLARLRRSALRLQLGGELQPQHVSQLEQLLRDQSTG
jgi:3-deoxy-D-manno-octulosonic acid kinase